MATAFRWIAGTGSTRSKGHLVRNEEKLTLCGRPIAKSWRFLPTQMVFEPCGQCLESQVRIKQHDAGRTVPVQGKLELGFDG
jgi:hypothetical protein